MTDFTRTQAFRSYARMFQLPGTESLRLVDTTIATPVVGLENVIRSGLAELWAFTVVLTPGAAGAQVRDMDPWSSTDFEVVSRSGRDVVNTTLLPQNHDAIIIGAGASAAADNIDDLALFKGGSNAAISTSVRQILWWGNATRRIGDANDLMVVNETNGSEFRTALPWPIWNPSIEVNRLRLEGRVSATGDISFTMGLITGPAGSLPLR